MLKMCCCPEHLGEDGHGRRDQRIGVERRNGGAEAVRGQRAPTGSRRAAQGQGRHGGDQPLAAPGRPCRRWQGKESSEGREGSVQSCSISARKEAPSLHGGERTYLHSCTSHLPWGHKPSYSIRRGPRWWRSAPATAHCPEGREGVGADSSFLLLRFFQSPEPT